MGDESSLPRSIRSNRPLKIAALSLPVLLMLCCFLPLVSANNNVASTLVRQMVGYTAYLLPIVLMITGLRLIVSYFWKPYPFHRYLLSVVAGTILLVNLVVIVHGIILGGEPMGELLVNPAYQSDSDPYRIWNEAVPTCGLEDSPIVQELESQGWVSTFGRLDSMQVARCGWGGGLMGAVIYGAGYNLLGGLAIFFLSISGLGLGAILWTFSIFDQLRWNQRSLAH